MVHGADRQDGDPGCAQRASGGSADDAVSGIAGGVVERRGVGARGRGMPDVAANSLSIAFGNFRAGYLVADRGETRILRDPFSNKPFVHFYATKRVGGAIIDSQAIKLMKFAAS